MNKLLLTGVALAALTGTSLAADLPSRKGPVAVPYAPIFTWTGLYVGAHIGYADTRSRFTDLSGYNLLGERFSGNKGNVFGGGQVGYNYQIGSFVLGAELDLGYMGLEGSRTQPSSPAGDTRAKLDSGFYGALTGRLGFAMDRVLVYGKGGVAYLGSKASVVDVCNVGACGVGLLNATSSSDRWGWTLGAGVEYAFTNNISAKVEYQYFDFGNERATGLLAGAPIVYRSKLDIHTVKLGVNYRF